MEETFVDAQKEGQEKESQFSLNKDIGLVEDTSSEITEFKLRKLCQRVKPGQTLTSDVKQQNTGERCIQELNLRRLHDTDLSIPKDMCVVHLNEKYLRHCLDLVEFRASDFLSVVCSPVASRNIAVNLRSSRMEILFNGLGPRKNRRRNTSFGQWFVGTIEGNDSVRNILKSPLFQHLGDLDSNVNVGRVGSVDAKETKCSNFMSSPSALTISSPRKLETEKAPIENEKYGSIPLHKRLVSISSTNSLYSDQSSSSSASATVSQGMLHCIWKSGIPYFVFSIDDQKEVYVANLWKVESSDDKDLDYMYLFHSRFGGQKENRTCDNVSDLVGKMKVSSSLTLCSNSSKHMETEFVLFGANEDHFGDMRSSAPTLRKIKGSPKKVTNMFRRNHLFKHRSTPEFGEPNSILEDFSGDSCQDMSNKLDALGEAKLLESPPNLELAAIVVKDHLHDNSQEVAVGGWGLKFLEKVRVEHAKTSRRASVSSDSCLRNKSDCSTSMKVLLPAGYHGGPRSRNGGPSSLTKRWQSGGYCDCGGWDIGCPLTVLNNRSSKEVLPQADAQGECKSFDLFKEGTNQGLPTLKMVNIHNGLYIIHFQSTLSALQSFSIGVAIIHAQSPTLCPKNIQKLKLKESGLRFM